MKQQIMLRGVSLSAIFLLVTIVSLRVIFNIKSLRLERSWWSVILATLALGGSLYLGMDRNTWLPFLGEGVVPYSVLRESVPSEASLGVTVSTDTDPIMCMYWASDPADGVVSDPWTAYNEFENAGVVPVENGQALLQLNCPGQYKVPRKSRPLPRHVHYRWVYANGIASEVLTQNVDC
jgi:hypothetical protein